MHNCNAYNSCLAVVVSGVKKFVIKIVNLIKVIMRHIMWENTGCCDSPGAGGFVCQMKMLSGLHFRVNTLIKTRPNLTEKVCFCWKSYLWFSRVMAAVVWYIYMHKSYDIELGHI